MRYHIVATPSEPNCDRCFKPILEGQAVMLKFTGIAKQSDSYSKGILVIEDSEDSEIRTEHEDCR